MPPFGKKSKKKVSLAKKTKRAWRKLPDAAQSPEASLASLRALTGVSSMKSAELFTISHDKKDASSSAKASKKKTLYLDNLLDRTGMPVVPWGTRNQHGKTGVQRPQKPTEAPPQKTKTTSDAASQPSKRKRTSASEAIAAAARLRGDDVDEDLLGHDTHDAWGDANNATTKKHYKNKTKTVMTNERRMTAPPAVVVDLPGCSYNPDPEYHADAIATAVAAEASKLDRAHLRPKPPPEYVPWSAQDDMDELGLLQVDEPTSDDDDDDDDDEDSEGIHGPGDGGESTAVATPTKHPGKGGGRGGDLYSTAGLTPAEVNRKRRAKERDAEERRAKEQRRVKGDLGQLKKLAREVDEEEKAREEARERRKAEEAQRMASRPLRLSKHLYQSPDLQVLTTDEAANSSLRTLAAPAFSSLVVDRYKHLQRRGMLEVNRKQEMRRPSRKIKHVERDRMWETSRVFAPPCPKPAPKQS
ncbi:nucleolar protein 53 [Pseudoscourfieldia marina]